MAFPPPSSPRPTIAQPLLPSVFNVDTLDPELRAPCSSDREDVEMTDADEVSTTSAERPKIDEEVVIERLRRPPRPARAEGSTSRMQTRSMNKKDEQKMVPMPGIHERRKLVQVLPDHNGRFRADAVTQNAIAENMVREIEQAFRLFEDREYIDCYELCLAIVDLEPSEAVRAKAHMLLGAIPVAYTSLEFKLFQIEQSLKQWTTVIARTGRSRYPIDKARVELAAVQAHMTRLRTEIADHALQAMQLDYRANSTNPNW